MEFINNITALVSLYFVYRGTGYLLGIKQSFKYLESNLNYSRRLNKESCPYIVILLPLLREQTVINEMVSYFSGIIYPKQKLAIVLITTEKEISEYKNGFKRLPTTVDLVKPLIDKANAKLKTKLFHHIHYPKTEGVMAHQLNYAVENLENIVGRKLDPPKTYVVVYNADSKPNKRTLQVFYNQILLAKKKFRRMPEIFQQIAAYVHNYRQYPNTFSGLLLKASSVVQTRWALGYEIPMLRRQSEFWLKRKGKKLSILEKIFEPPAYCVGHGVFYRLDTLHQVDLFPDETLNEDLALGYYSVLSGFAIMPLPSLENVENPNSVTMLIEQKSAWFWGMLDYLTYKKFVHKKVQNPDPIRVWMTTLRGIKRDTLAWALSSIFVLYLLISPFLIDKSFIIFPVSAIILYIITPSVLLLINLPRIFRLSSGEKVRISKTELILVAVFSIPYLLISSLGPWLTIAKKVRWIVFGIKPSKKKTER